jgi:hypothetical protein
VVTQGVAANEGVVVAGQMLIRPGGKVRVDGASSRVPAIHVDRPTNQAPGGQS